MPKGDPGASGEAGEVPGGLEGGFGVKGYIELGTSDNPSYMREDSVGELATVTAIVFDCDGVLIDVSEAYRKAVAETAFRITEGFTCIRLPEDLIDVGVFHAFKKTGGFNNDWDLTYAIIAHIISRLPRRTLNQLDEAAGASLGFDDPKGRLGYIANKVEKGPLPALAELKQGLLDYAGRLDETGVSSIDENLDQPLGINLRRALGCPRSAGGDLIPTLFEQLFCGTELYEETFGAKPSFDEAGRGFVEEIAPETMERLTRQLGGPHFGIASGSMATPARYVLGETLDEMNPEAQVWMDDVDRAEEETGAGNLGKPNPFSLTNASRALEPFEKALYVGDTMADLIMVKRACEEDPRYLFAGVYRYAGSDEAALKGFLDEGADIVAPSVNELPMILEYVRGEKI
jgi:HAD superfamily hydrolase (TIGR01548 family)